jgi:hypothetical protein
MHMLFFMLTKKTPFEVQQEFYDDNCYSKWNENSQDYLDKCVVTIAAPSKVTTYKIGWMGELF